MARHEIEVARISLMPPAKGASPDALARKARRVMAWLQTLRALPAELEVCEIVQSIEPHGSQFWLALTVRPRTQQVLCFGPGMVQGTQALRQAVERDARTVRQALGQIALETEVAVATIKASHASGQALAAGLEKACTVAVLGLAGRSFQVVVQDEHFSVEIPGLERSYDEPVERIIAGVVTRISASAFVLNAVQELGGSRPPGVVPLPSKLAVAISSADATHHLDALLLRSMRRRVHLPMTVRAKCCVVTGQPVGGTLVEVGTTPE